MKEVGQIETKDERLLVAGCVEFVARQLLSADLNFDFPVISQMRSGPSVLHFVL